MNTKGLLPAGVASILSGIVSPKWAEDTAHFTDLALPTGVGPLDLALGGGFSSGIACIWGEESVGKTGFLANILANAQRSGLGVLLASSEFLDLPYLEACGLDLDQLCVLKTRHLETMVTVALDFLQACPPCVVGIDSLSAYRPVNDAAGEWNERVFDFVSMLSDSLPAGSLVLTTSQVRMAPSTNPHRVFSDKRSQVRRVEDLLDANIECRRLEVHDEKFTLEVTVHKSAFGRPGSQVTLPFTKGQGVNLPLVHLYHLISLGAVQQRGAHFYTLEDEHLGLGEAEAALVLWEKIGSSL